MIRLEALDGLRVYLDGEELRDLPTKPQRAAMLVYLAVEGGATRERLCFLLWPDSDGQRVRRALSQTLYGLRRELGDSWVDVVGDRLITTADLEVDLDAFGAALDDGRDVDAIDLYRGPFLEGVRLGGGVDFEHWIDAKRIELHRNVRRAFRRAFEKDLSTPEALRLARAWVGIDALDDEAQHILVEQLALNGNRTAALDQYERYRDLIRSELDIEPMDRTEALVEQIRNGTFPRIVGSGTVAEGRGSEQGGPGQAPARGRQDLPAVSSDLDVARVLGEGSAGVVYLAREPALRRLVAIKVLKAELAENATARARFKREAQSAAKILHPHVATVYRVGTTDDDRPFFVMPYVKGVTLADRLESHGPLPVGEVRRILAEVASALAAAHGVGVVHRDVRPANVLCDDRSGRTYLADFGIAAVLESGGVEVARLTQTGEVLGHLDYVSPEQRRGLEMDGRSDVYSLGVMGLELLLAGSAPSLPDLAERVDAPDLVDLLRRATADNPKHRPSASEFARAVSDPTHAREESESRWLRPLRDRRMLPLIGGYLAVVLAGIGVVDLLVQRALLDRIAYGLAFAFFAAGGVASLVLAWFQGRKGRQR
jgi:DNA-binding SARP family transcriptional activator/tRNA A-37 threonylcarbamoyl transferase component Bud32